MHSESLRSNGTLTLHYLLRQILYIIIKWTHTHTHSPPTTDWCKQLNILLFHIRVRGKRLNITLIHRSFKCKQLNILLFQFSIRCKQLNMLLFQARAVSQYFYQYILWTWEIWISIFLYTYTDNGVISVLYFLCRDLKTNNIFLTKEGIIKVGDFGISKMLGSVSNGAQTVLGTPYYISPEMVNSYLPEFC